MGYYTLYRFSAQHFSEGNISEIHNPETQARICEEFLKITEDYFLSGEEEKSQVKTLFELDELISDEIIKWYDYQDHMIKLSRCFPRILFTLHGEGEQSEDIWDEHYLNGFYQTCSAKIEIPPFKESELCMYDD